jgi:hypothetical protein
MTTEVAAILERARMLGRDEQAELAVELVALLDDIADDPAEVERPRRTGGSAAVNMSAATSGDG